MTYSQRVKASKKVLQAMDSLGEDQSFSFIYDERQFEMKCFAILEDGNKLYSVYQKGPEILGMNVEKITPTSFTLYTFNMMGLKTTYKMGMDKMEII